MDHTEPKPAECASYDIEWSMFCSFCNIKMIKPNLEIEVEPVNPGSKSYNFLVYVTCPCCKNKNHFKHQILEL